MKKKKQTFVPEERVVYPQNQSIIEFLIDSLGKERKKIARPPPIFQVFTNRKNPFEPPTIFI
ncbi:hypothetical protein [Bacteroides sedimenti]|uniref:Uncharacterized protein n=1 Tax=Bacteroides sedimenti TaxID=2136147 RepID=A0ABN6ZC42_9BACE